MKTSPQVNIINFSMGLPAHLSLQWDAKENDVVF